MKILLACLCVTLVGIIAIIAYCTYMIGYLDGKAIEAKDYQLNIHFDTIWVYSDGKLIDSFTTNWDTKLDSIILKDNK